MARLESEFNHILSSFNGLLPERARQELTPFTWVTTMNNQDQKCPFKVDDLVVYNPSERGWGQVVMSSPSGKLERGKQYIISAIVKDAYIIVEGYSDPGGEIHWTEFKRKLG